MSREGLLYHLAGYGDLGENLIDSVENYGFSRYTAKELADEFAEDWGDGAVQSFYDWLENKE